MGVSSTPAPPSAPDGLALAAKTVRVLTIDAVRQAGIGHTGMPLGCAEIGSVLFGEILRHDPRHPDWPDRDRFVLSAGHGSMLLYSLLHLSGYALPIEEIRNFRQLGSITPGHPERGVTPGVETTTGPLGQGFANAVGMALAERMLQARFGSELVDHRTYVLASDGDLMEGVASEAASLAGHLGLGRLIVLYDDNGITIDGPTGLTFSEDVPQRFAAYGWSVQEVDGHDPVALRAALQQAAESEECPHLIACRTHIGTGSPAIDTSAAHGALGGDACEQTRQNLGWTLPPFELPDEAHAFFRPNAERGARLHGEWNERKRRALRDPRVAERWDAFHGRKLPDDLDALGPDWSAVEKIATRQASGRFLNAVAARVPALVGGSCDLSGSNNTRLDDGGDVAPRKFDGRNLHFGVREHGGAGVANGMAQHGGLRPLIATFLVFSDYMRPSLRLAALSELPVVFVFTHDSIFVGEDGPTHQPVEQVAALRAVPNLCVWRPADARETVVAWMQALRRNRGPVALALTRQGVPVLSGSGVEEGARRGGYTLVPELADGPPELVLVATGSEVHLATAAASALAAEGRRVRVVSVPCVEWFRGQDEAYQRQVLPEAPPRLLIEAGVSVGLAQLTRPGDRVHALDRFGVSAPYTVLGTHFGFTAEAVTALAREMLA